MTLRILLLEMAEMAEGLPNAVLALADLLATIV
jgi:hypothetical protein